ncbi:hypothetical protein [Actinoplanes teichomyceticus]|uniref:hypothetical protein n=1 Tax=Actinoplanes teichomyceticus TaxID=1867 RepID=UPI00119EDEBE|nr:hypothetical protein [Actinoplanes teichomyceticus]
MLADDSGLTMLLELGDPAALLAEARTELPAPWELLSDDGRARPPGRVQLLLTGVPAPAGTLGSGPVAGSYRMLTEGRALGHARAMLAVRVLRAEGWSDGELHRTLTGQVRRLAKRLPAQPVDAAGTAGTLADLAYADPTAEIHEDWTVLRVGGLAQVTFHGQPRAVAGPSAALLTRLLHLPAAATTVTLTADLPESGSDEPPLISVAVRLAAAEPATLNAAAGALRQLAAGEHVRLRRRDGEHGPGLAATLPLGVTNHSPHGELGGEPEPRRQRQPRAGKPRQPGQVPDRERTGPDAGFGRLVLPTAWAGLTVGRNRYGHPVLIRLFRPEHTRALMIGGMRCAQLVVFRAMAVGARVLVRTDRPHAWEPFVRGTATPGSTIGIVPPDRPADLPPSSPVRPLLVVLDVPLRPATCDGATPPSNAAHPRAGAHPAPGVTSINAATINASDIAAGWPTQPDSGGFPHPAAADAWAEATAEARTGARAGAWTGATAEARAEATADARTQATAGAWTGATADARTEPPTNAWTEATADAGPWTATLTVREAFGAADVGAAIGADLLLLQALRSAEAALIGTALALGDTAQLLTRMRPGMVGVINRQAVRWAMLSPTPVEKVLVGDPDRSTDEP